MAVIPPQHWLPYGEHMRRLFYGKILRGWMALVFREDGGIRRFVLY
ncbi:hypothetical protein HMPREF9555_00987 [Selenomonas artemidis F0399]|uniref:Uncharacterized protein n=1 Tax=Selenomonas artemidis F0399 TaxID=749551 RepID=E7N1X7_9FIRM|nr:hypothetical protein HMPREF9555_00987 [Selenomonas artemidis F0399]